MGKKEEELAKMEKALTEKEKALNEREKALTEKEQLLDEWGDELETLKLELAEKEKALDQIAAAPVEKEKPLSRAEIALLEKACEAYGIPEEYVLTARIDKGEAVIVTHGGAKVRYKKGDEKEEGFRPLDPIRVDGVIRKKMKPITGGKKSKK